MSTTVSALIARRNFGELINQVLYKREEILIERKGKPVAKIVPVQESTSASRDILSYAGIWKTKDVTSMKNAIRRVRTHTPRPLQPL